MHNMTIILNKRHIKIKESLTPISWLSKIFIINCNWEKQTFSYPNVPLIKMVFMVLLFGSISAYSLYYKVQCLDPIITASVVLTDIIQLIYNYFQYIVDLWFVYKFKKNVSCDYFKQYEIIDKILNISDFSQLKWRLTKQVFFFIVLWLITSVTDFIAWVLSYGFLINVPYIISYIYLLINITTVLDLTSHVMHIEVRLQKIADVVKHIYRTSESLPGLINNNNSKGFSFLQNQGIIEICSKVFSKESCDHKILTRCYFLLTDQVEFVNKIFGFRIVIYSLSLLIDMIRFTNLGARILIGKQETTFKLVYFPAVTCMMRVMTSATVCLCLVQHCEKVFIKHRKIVVNVDRLLVNKVPDETLRYSMSELRNFMLARPIKFNMCDFIQLNNSFLISLASVVVTYSIILLQN